MAPKTQSLIITVDGLKNPESAEILISYLLLKYRDMSLGNISVFCIFPLREKDADTAFILTAILKGNVNQVDGFRSLLLPSLLVEHSVKVFLLSCNFLFCHFISFLLTITVCRGK